MGKSQVIWDSLLAYIDTYEVVVYSTSGLCSVIFLTSIAVLSKKFGLLEQISQVTLSCADYISTGLLFFSVIFCIATFVSNFYLQNALSEFWKPIFLPDVPDPKGCCDWDKWNDNSIEILVNYFRDTHNQKLRGLTAGSFIFSGISSALLFLWFMIQMLLRIQRPKPERRG